MSDSLAAKVVNGRVKIFKNGVVQRTFGSNVNSAIIMGDQVQTYQKDGSMKLYTVHGNSKQTLR